MSSTCRSALLVLAVGLLGCGQKDPDLLLRVHRDDSNVKLSLGACKDSEPNECFLSRATLLDVGGPDDQSVAIYLDEPVATVRVDFSLDNGQIWCRTLLVDTSKVSGELDITLPALVDTAVTVAGCSEPDCVESALCDQ